jgi:small subunit ribosomal protein S23
LEPDAATRKTFDWRKVRVFDFSHPRGMLTCSSVIQRQLWLLNHVPGISNAEAYDVARKEFYTLRHEEEVERRVAREEALWTGAYFGKSVLEIGMELEDKIYESWKAWATKEAEAISLQRNAAYTGIGIEDEAEAPTELDAAEEPAVS